jgi:hypothetical protein
MIDLASDLDGRASETNGKPKQKATTKQKQSLTRKQTISRKATLRQEKPAGSADVASDPTNVSDDKGDGFCRRLLRQVRECEEQIARGVGQSTRVFAGDLEALEGSGHLRSDGPAVEMCGVEHWEQQLFEAQDSRFGALLEQQHLSLLSKLSPGDANDLISYVRYICKDGERDKPKAGQGGDPDELFFCCPDIDQLRKASQAHRAHWQLKRQQRHARRKEQLEEEQRLQQEQEATAAMMKGMTARQRASLSMTAPMTMHKSSSVGLHHKATLTPLHKSSSASLLASSAPPRKPTTRGSTTRGSTSLGLLREGLGTAESMVSSSRSSMNSRSSLSSTRVHVPRAKGRVAAVLLLAELVSEFRTMGSSAMYAAIGATLRKDGRLAVQRHFAEHVSVQRAALAAAAANGLFRDAGPQTEPVVAIRGRNPLRLSMMLLDVTFDPTSVHDPPASLAFSSSPFSSLLLPLQFIPGHCRVQAALPPTATDPENYLFDVFVSVRARTEPEVGVATQLAKELRGRGLRVYLDHEDDERESQQRADSLASEEDGTLAGRHGLSSTILSSTISPSPFELLRNRVALQLRRRRRRRSTALQSHCGGEYACAGSEYAGTTAEARESKSSICDGSLTLGGSFQPLTLAGTIPPGAAAKMPGSRPRRLLKAARAMQRSRLVMCVFGFKSVGEVRGAIGETRVRRSDESLAQWTCALEMAAAGRVKELVPVLVIDLGLEGRSRRTALLERKRLLEEAGDFDTDPRDYVPTGGKVDLAASHELCTPFSEVAELPGEMQEEIGTWMTAPPLTTLAAVRSVLLGVGCTPSSGLQRRVASDCLEALLHNGGWSVKEGELNLERQHMLAEEVRIAAAQAEAEAAKRRAGFYRTKAQKAVQLSEADPIAAAAAHAESAAFSVRSKVLRPIVDDVLHRLQRSTETKPMAGISCGDSRKPPAASSHALQQYPVHPPALPSGAPCTCLLQIELSRHWRRQAVIAIAMERAAAVAVPAALSTAVMVDRLRAGLLPGLVAHARKRADEAEEIVLQAFLNVDTFLHEVSRVNVAGVCRLLAPAVEHNVTAVSHF